MKGDVSYVIIALVITIHFVRTGVSAKESGKHAVGPRDVYGEVSAARGTYKSDYTVVARNAEHKSSRGSQRMDEKVPRETHVSASSHRTALGSPVEYAKGRGHLERVKTVRKQQKYPEHTQRRAERNWAPEEMHDYDMPEEESVNPVVRPQTSAKECYEKLRRAEEKTHELMNEKNQFLRLVRDLRLERKRLRYVEKSLTANLTLATGELAECEQRVKDLDDNVVSSEAQIAALTSKISRLKDQLDAAEMSEELLSCQVHNDELTGNLTSARKSNRLLQSQVSTLQMTLDALKSELAVIQNQTWNFTYPSVDVTTPRDTTLSGEITLSTGTQDALATDSQQHHGQMGDKSEQESSKANEKNAQLMATNLPCKQLSQANDTNEALQAQVQHMQSELVALRSHLEESNAENTDLRSQLAARQLLVDALQSDRSQLLQRVTSYESTSNELSDQLSRALNETTHWKSQALVLQERNSNLATQVASLQDIIKSMQSHVSASNDESSGVLDNELSAVVDLIEEMRAHFISRQKAAGQWPRRVGPSSPLTRVMFGKRLSAETLPQSRTVTTDKALKSANNYGKNAACDRNGNCCKENNDTVGEMSTNPAGKKTAASPTASKGSAARKTLALATNSPPFTNVRGAIHADTTPWPVANMKLRAEHSDEGEGRTTSEYVRVMSSQSTHNLPQESAKAAESLKSSTASTSNMLMNDQQLSKTTAQRSDNSFTKSPTSMIKVHPFTQRSSHQPTTESPPKSVQTKISSTNPKMRALPTPTTTRPANNFSSTNQPTTYEQMTADNRKPDTSASHTTTADPGSSLDSRILRAVKTRHAGVHGEMKRDDDVPPEALRTFMSPGDGAVTERVRPSESSSLFAWMESNPLSVIAIGLLALSAIVATIALVFWRVCAPKVSADVSEAIGLDYDTTLARMSALHEAHRTPYIGAAYDMRTPHLDPRRVMCSNPSQTRL